MMIDRRTLVATGAVATAAAMLPDVTIPATHAGAPMATGQAPGFYRFKVGDYQVTAIHEGFFYRPVEGFVRNAKNEDVQKALSAAFLPTDRFPIPITTLVVNTGSKLVLIDAGIADYGPPQAGQWMANFKAAGFSPEQVDIVLVSHFHGDHINGLRPKSGTEAFPNAEIKVPEPEWSWWMDDGRMNSANDALKGAFQNARRVFKDSKNVARFEWGKEVAPGITPVKADGHTPGHSAFMISSGAGKLLHLVDAANHPALFVRHPGWQAVFDMSGPIAETTRKRLLDMAAAEKTQVALYHAPFPGVGHITKAGAGYDFHPIAWNNQA